MTNGSAWERLRRSEFWERLGRAKFWTWLAPFGNVVGVVCGLVGVVTDLFSTAVRVTIVVVGLLLWLGASVGSALVAWAQRDDQEEIDELRARLAIAGVTDRDLPDHALRMLAPAVFRKGTSWRLTLFVLEEESGAWYLCPKIRCASSELYEATARQRIPLESSVVRELKSLELPANGEQGDAPDREKYPTDWLAWQQQFVTGTRVIQSLRMPTRKYAWCAARQPGHGGQTIALVAETVQASGINSEVLASNLLPPMLEMVTRLVNLPEAVDPTG